MRYALLAGGGASRGAVQVGPAQRLREAYGPPTVQVGTSTGALTVSVDPATLREAYEGVKGTRTFQGLQVDVWMGLYSLRRLRRLLDEYEACSDLPCPTWVGCYDLSRQRYRLVALHELDDVADRRDAVVASCAIPLIHQPREVRGEPLADGGVRSVLGRLPEGIPALDAVHVLACSPLGRRARRKPRAEHEVRQVWEQAAVCYEEWQTTVSVQDLAYLRGLDAPVHVWEPPDWESVGAPFDASPERIRSRLELGDTMPWPERLT